MGMQVRISCASSLKHPLNEPGRLKIARPAYLATFPRGRLDKLGTGSAQARQDGSPAGVDFRKADAQDDGPDSLARVTLSSGTDVAVGAEPEATASLGNSPPHRRVDSEAVLALPDPVDPFAILRPGVEPEGKSPPIKPSGFTADTRPATIAA